jgi:hypothetical protein
MKDANVVRWNLANRPAQMASIYGAWDWRKFLATQPGCDNLDL